MVNMHKCTRSVAIKETVVKLHTRWYYTPFRIHGIHPTIPDTCFRDCGERGTLLHTFWRCKLSLATDSYKSTPNNWNEYHLDIPNVYPVCRSSRGRPPPHPEQKLVHTLYSAIHWAIALNWRTSTVPWSQVLLRMESIKLMEQIHHTLMDSNF